MLQCVTYIPAETVIFHHKPVTKWNNFVTLSSLSVWKVVAVSVTVEKLWQDSVHDIGG